MPQCWLKNLAVITISAVLLSSCQKTEYSTDEPLPDTNTPSIYIGSQNRYLYAFNPYTGSKKWEFNMQANLQATPVVIGTYLLVPTEGNLIKLDANTGKLLHTYSYENENVTAFISSPTTGNNTLYVATLAGKVYAIDMKDDKLQWVYNAGEPIASSLTLHNGELIVSSVTKVHSVAVLNGVATWTHSVPVDFCSPVVAPPYIYIGGGDGVLYALDILTGAQKWTYPTGGPIRSSPLVYGGNIIFGSDDYNVYCIDSVAKTARWIFPTADRVVSSPYASDQVIYFGSYDYYFYAINIIDGTLRWKYNTGALIKGSPLVKFGMVYFGGFDKQFYAFDTSGAIKWKTNINGSIETSPVYYDLQKAYYPTISGLSPL